MAEPTTINEMVEAYLSGKESRSIFNPEVNLGWIFTVSVGKANLGAFTDFTLPGLTMETMDIIEGGQNTYVHKLPVRSTAGTAKLKHGITSGLELLSWYSDVLSGNLKNATREVEVALMDSTREVLITWNFSNAFPTKWTGPNLSTSSSAVAIEELEFVHHGFSVKASG